MEHTTEKNKKIKKILIIIISILLAIIVALVSAFYILSHIGKKQFHKEDTHISNEAVKIEDDTTITYQGKEYVLNKNIVSTLVIGVDRENINQNLGAGNNGQADVIFVATVDTKTKKACIIPISRETLVDVNLYTADGKFAGTEKQQICLAYAYGTTPQKCSENVLTSTKRLLYGINISRYVAIELDGIEKLTNMVGGVPITCLEDIKLGNAQYTKGQNINLKGKLAINYIQHREWNGLNANDRRMQRQKQFLSALINQTGNAVMADFTKLGTFYTALSPYFSTSVSLAQITYLAKECLTINFGDSLNYKSIEGTLQQGEKWVEFIPNEDSVLQTVIDTFYIPKV
ncbi:MAG: LCP family protein [Clostridia bacterium]|nr:LCP family protein [Clostridia bacterium]